MVFYNTKNIDLNAIRRSVNSLHKTVKKKGKKKKRKRSSKKVIYNIYFDKMYIFKGFKDISYSTQTRAPDSRAPRPHVVLVEEGNRNEEGGKEKRNVKIINYAMFIEELCIRR